MKLGDGTHLTYCTNIHPGETWAEVRENLERHLVRVRAQIAPGRRFGIGLRLSSRAADDLSASDELSRFRAWLSENDLYVFTINGFPYGQFHGMRVKENVYLPDWLDDERVVYTEKLARILAALLPDDVAAGSVSTVPGAFRPRVRGVDDEKRMADNIARSAAAFMRIEAETGKLIRLALEPEPYCHFETTEETIRFFEARLLLPAREKLVRRYVGVCFDACHLAVEFEDAREGPRRFEEAGIGIFKVQLSAGLEAAAPEGLERFAEDVYLHQVVERSAAGLKRHLDLPEALAAGMRGTWRVHFHVPLFREELGTFRNTQAYLRELLQRHREKPISDHLEVETYTWDVLPEEYRREDVAMAIARELRWVTDVLDA
jgi:sugar phosphate isomerase/epimerase